MSQLRIWELHIDADPHLCVQQADLRYFWDKFDGRPMSEGWVTPPYEILGRSKKVADFTSWQIGSRTFLVSSEARGVLADLSGDDIEFLPFDRIKGRDLFAVNVLRIEDYIDTNRSEFSPGSGCPTRVIWKRDLPSKLPPLFKVRRSPETYASLAFAEKAAEAGLTGLSLADPAKNRLLQIVRREQINEYQGLGLRR